MKRFLGALVLLAVATASRAQQSPSPASAPPPVRQSFLVLLREQADLSGAAAIPDRLERRRFVFDALNDVADRTQAPLVEELRASGARVRRHFLLNMLEMEADDAAAASIARRPEVSRVASNRPAAMGLVPDALDPGVASAGGRAPLAATTVGENLDIIRAPQVWARGFTGQGIVVGHADTGFAWEHPALKPHYRGFDGSTVSHAYNWHDAVHDAAAGNPCGSDSAFPCDDDSDGHGTSTAGILVGDDGLGAQPGVAPSASLIGCRNMDQGTGTPARYTECFEFLLAPTDAAGQNPRPDLGADVINNSWTCPVSEGCTDPDILRTIVANVRDAGIFVVVSAGNAGDACATITDAPAIYDIAFCVGATDNSDAIAPFSSRGPITVDGSNRLKPDLVAPGVLIPTSVPPDQYTFSFTGTSASAPHVSGAVALLWSAIPPLRGDVDQTEDLLRRSAVPLLSSQDCGPYPGNAVPNAVFGYGRLDVVNALVFWDPLPPRQLVLPHRSRPALKVIAPRTP
jgi:subtilisin family serine protease